MFAMSVIESKKSRRRRLTDLTQVCNIRQCKNFRRKECAIITLDDRRTGRGQGTLAPTIRTLNFFGGQSLKFGQMLFAVYAC